MARDRIFAGNFRSRDRQDIVIKAPNDLGLITWNRRSQTFHLISDQSGWIDNWNVSRNDRIFVGDFDGDGLDEIYIRSLRWAGLLKWRGNRFRLLWSQNGELTYLGDDDEDWQVPLNGPYESYVGRFLPGRDCILHEDSNSVSVLAWDGSAMGVRQQRDNPIDGRRIVAADKFVVGDFHGVGPDVGKPAMDYVGDQIEDVFIHSGSSTAMIGVNYTEWDPVGNPGRFREEMGLTWVQDRNILTFITGG